MRIAHFALISMVVFTPFLVLAAEQPAHVEQKTVAQDCDDSQPMESEAAECRQAAATDHDLSPSYVEIAIEHVEDAAVPDPMKPSPEQEDYAE